MFVHFWQVLEMFQEIFPTTMPTQHYLSMKFACDHFDAELSTRLRRVYATRRGRARRRMSAHHGTRQTTVTVIFVFAFGYVDIVFLGRCGVACNSCHGHRVKGGMRDEAVCCWMNFGSWRYRDDALEFMFRGGRFFSDIVCSLQTESAPAEGTCCRTHVCWSRWDDLPLVHFSGMQAQRAAGRRVKLAGYLRPAGSEGLRACKYLQRSVA